MGSFLRCRPRQFLRPPASQQQQPRPHAHDPRRPPVPVNCCFRTYTRNGRRQAGASARGSFPNSRCAPWAGGALPVAQQFPQPVGFGRTPPAPPYTRKTPPGGSPARSCACGGVCPPTEPSAACARSQQPLQGAHPGAQPVDLFAPVAQQPQQLPLVVQQPRNLQRLLTQVLGQLVLQDACLQVLPAGFDRRRWIRF